MVYEKPKGLHWRTYERPVWEVKSSNQVSQALMMKRLGQGVESLRLIRALAEIGQGGIRYPKVAQGWIKF